MEFICELCGFVFFDCMVIVFVEEGVVYVIVILGL